ncbi:MAG: ABC transporter permease [Planctomycetota bacterium]|jgi:ABC-2 type transport system permease protein
MLHDIWMEILKIKSQKKNYIVIVGHLIMVGLIYLGFKLSNHTGHMARRMSEVSGLDFKEMIDAMFFARTVFVPTLLMIFPIFICTLAGDLVAGEYQDGSLKLYASRSRSRSNIMLSKIFAMALYSIVYCFYFSLACLAAGFILFKAPGAQLITLVQFGLSTELTIMSFPETLERYLYITLYHSVSTLSLGCLTIFFSTIFNRMTSATIAGLTLYFTCYIIGGIPMLSNIKPYLITTVMNGSHVMWLDKIPIGRIIEDLSILGIYTVVFCTLATVVFNAKDIK